MKVRAMESPERMELFVSCTLPSGLIRMLFPQAGKGTLLAEDPYPSSTATANTATVKRTSRSFRSTGPRSSSTPGPSPSTPR